MRIRNGVIVLVAVVLGFSAEALAETTFVFHLGSTNGPGPAGSFFSGKTTDSYTQSGLTLTATANGPGDGTVFNGTSSYFGINAGTSGASGDDTDEFDTAGGGAEYMVFSFDHAGTFDSIDFALLTEEDQTEAILSFAGGNSYNINNSTANLSGDVQAIGEAFAAGQQITLSTSADDHNFALQAFTVTVPEPSALIMLLGGIGLLLLLRRRH